METALWIRRRMCSARLYLCVDYIQVKHSHKGPLLLTALTIYQFASLSKMSSSYATKLISIIGTQLSCERVYLELFNASDAALQ